jgi:hypothetical protein
LTRSWRRSEVVAIRACESCGGAISGKRASWYRCVICSRNCARQKQKADYAGKRESAVKKRATEKHPTLAQIEKHNKAIEAWGKKFGLYSRWNIELAGKPDKKLEAAIDLLDKRMRAVGVSGGVSQFVYADGRGKRCFEPISTKDGGSTGTTIVAFICRPEALKP